VSNPPDADAAATRRAGWDDARLVRACLGGDQEAWAAIIQRYRRLIYSIPLRYGARPEDAADVFQTVCLELFAELPKLRRVDSLRAWLVTVTAHQAFHWKRRHGRRSAHEAGEIDADTVAVAPIAPEELEAAEREQLLREALGQLPDRCHTLIRLLFFEPTPIPYKEVGRRLGLATGSIGFIRGRCLTKLQRLLERAGFPG
jgi:RNA polymerase sigma factor (sigma-70 family)